MSEHAGKENVADLVKKYYPPLKSFIRRRVASREDAEDILQDVFYQLIKTVETDPIEQVSGWLYHVARNMIINKGKKKQEEKLPVHQYDEGGDILNEFSKVLFNDDAPTPETEYLRSLVWQELETALAELPPEQREAFELTELDGLLVKEVAKTIGISVNTLLSRKHYAVKHLRKRLEVLYHEMLYC
jgi:RNA polymerase sigma factor (sigma-70 family)